ncbi:MAG TPA: metalloregulator ArsR/SmtB family transcription factor [bacterium]|jgi:ArsR family transcriptional regulator
MTRESERRLKALADPGRLSVLALVHEASEICVCKIEQALKLPQPTVSRHLNRLKEAGWVLDRRQGRWMHYRMADGKDSAWYRVLELVLSQPHPQPRLRPKAVKGSSKMKTANTSQQLELEC